MTSGEHTKGHTELPWMAASAYSSVCGVPIVNQQGRRIANTALPDMPKEWDELKQQAVIDAAFIVTAVNTYPAVAELVKALELSLDTLHEAEAILGGEYGDHYGPLCEKMIELEEASASALTRFREAQAGGGA